jgi:hypothetical protein
MLCTAHYLFHCVNYWILVDNITRTFVRSFYVVSRCVLGQAGSACDAWVSLSEIPEIAFFTKSCYAWVSLSEIPEIAFFTKSRMEKYIPIVLERYVKVNDGFLILSLSTRRAIRYRVRNSGQLTLWRLISSRCAVGASCSSYNTLDRNVETFGTYSLVP